MIMMNNISLKIVTIFFALIMIIVALAFFYLYIKYGRKKYLRYWAASWAAYGFSTFLFWVNMEYPAFFHQIALYVALITHFILILYTFDEYEQVCVKTSPCRKVVEKNWFIGGYAFVVCSIGFATYRIHNLDMIHYGIYVFGTFTYMRVGYILLRNSNMTMEKLAGICFWVLGGYQLYYPILENTKTLAPFGVLIDTMLCLLVIIEILIAFLEQETLNLKKELHSIQSINQLEYELLNLENIGRVPQLICEMAVKELGYSMAWIGLIQKESGNVVPVARAGENSNNILKNIKVTSDDDEAGIGPTGCCIREKKYMTLSMAKAYYTHLPLNQELLVAWEKGLEDQGYRSCIAFPLIANDQVLGSLSIYSKYEEKVLLGDLTKLQVFAYIASIAIYNLNKFNEDRQSFQELVKMLSVIIDARDKYTAFHSLNVSKYAMGIARQMKLSGEQMQEIELCGLLHDIGKINVPDRLLHKEGPLDFEERKVVQTHSSMGANILSYAGDIFNISIINGIKHHHERYDGRGYPDRLKGEDIPLYAQIIAVADVFDAMTTDRPYRNALPKQAAISEIKNQSGGQFSQHVVEAFLKFIEETEAREFKMLMDNSSY